MQTNDVYNPRLIITDHFDEIKNQIDIKVETILEEQRQFGLFSSFNDKHINKINEIRDKQIKKIKEIEQSNLSQWPSDFDEKRYEIEWADLLSCVSLSGRHKIEKIKKSIIKRDVILMETPYLFANMSLWVMPFYVDEIDLKFAK